MTLSQPGPVKLQVQNVFEAFSRAERDLPVHEWEIGGLKVWPVLRNYHAFSLITRKAFNANSQIVRYGGTRHRLRQIAIALCEQWWASFRDRRQSDWLRQTDVTFLVNSSTRFFKVDGAWYNPYSDSFIKHLDDAGIDSLVLEVTSDGKFLVPRYAPSVFLQDRLFYRSMWAKATALAKWPELPESIEGWASFLPLFDEILGTGCRPSLQDLRFRARQILTFESLFRKILQKSRPAVGITSGYYSSDIMGFIRACRTLGILTIEVQHGVQGDQHFAYRSWANVPETGYDTMPEMFWTWTDLERRNIDSWAHWRSHVHRAVTGGNPCLNVYDRQGHSVSHAIQKRIGSESNSAVIGSIQVLFTVQAFLELPLTLIEAIRNSPDWTWWIRIHPQYWETREPLRRKFMDEGLSNIIIDEASDVPLVALLNHVDVHVTEFSSSVLEAHALGVPSVVINPMGASLFAEQMAKGIVTFAKDAVELCSQIEQQVGKRTKLQMERTDQTKIFQDGIAMIVDAVRQQRGLDERASATKAFNPPAVRLKAGT